MWCLCFLICYLGWSYFSFQGASVLEFHACSHCPQWFGSPTKENLSLLPLLFAMKWWDRISSVQLLSGVWSATPWTAAHQASCPLSTPEACSNSCHRVSDAIQPFHPLSSPSSPPSIFPSIQVFSNESVLCIRWPKYWSFSFSISPCNENSGLIFFRMDWLDFLAVQGTLKSLLQHHSLKASILRHSAFFTVQLSHPYMTTGKNHSLD